jgi:hypothetical protein
MWLVKPMLYSAKTQQGWFTFLMPPGVRFFYENLKGCEEIVDVGPLGFNNFIFFNFRISLYSSLSFTLC